MAMYWEDGQLRSLDDPAHRRRVALATLPCPLAYFTPESPVSVRFAATELHHAGEALGHDVAPVDAMAESIGKAAGRLRSTANQVAVALVPVELPGTAVARWSGTEVVAWPVDAPAVGRVLTCAVFAPPRNQRAAAAGLRLTGDAERGAAQRWATALGFDLALWRNLHGALAGAGAWSVVAGGADSPSTPPPADGAPFDAWRHVLVASGALTEASLTVDSAGDRPLACIAGWGQAYPLALEGGSGAGAPDLADTLNRLMQAVGR